MGQFGEILEGSSIACCSSSVVLKVLGLSEDTAVRFIFCTTTMVYFAVYFS